METDRTRALFSRLCEVGNDLEYLRGTTFHQGSMWLSLDDILHRLDLIIDTLAEARLAGGGARHAARANEDEGRHR